AFNNIINLDFYNMMKTDIFEILFRVMSWLFMYFFPNSTFIIFVILINVILSISIYRFFDDKILSNFSLLIYIYSFLFFSMINNILSQIHVISIIMFIITLNKEKICIIFIFSIIHFSSIVFIIFIYFHKYIKVKYFVIFGVFCLFLFVTDLNSRI